MKRNVGAIQLQTGRKVAGGGPDEVMILTVPIMLMLEGDEGDVLRDAFERQDKPAVYDEVERLLAVAEDACVEGFEPPISASDSTPTSRPPAKVTNLFEKLRVAEGRSKPTNPRRAR